MDDSEKKGLFGTSNTLFSGMTSGGLFGSENQGIFGGNIDGKFGSSRIFEGNSQGLFGKSSQAEQLGKREKEKDLNESIVKGLFQQKVEVLQRSGQSLFGLSPQLPSQTSNQQNQPEHKTDDKQ